MKVAILIAKSYDRQFFTAANSQHQHQLTFLEPKLVGRASALPRIDNQYLKKYHE
ncbi:hypothetical protein [Chamaesiphon sp. VAR_48_metabat_403]|uniref:hypothetical protein n=1 Tax=Chamaesiphon sp. VAR_48_metabat_403 TaxID=2964700 RepID=UPI00286E9D34|nr:hypothetical protein [Chamaesiphon sp. VAR_48_metabat_403]